MSISADMHWLLRVISLGHVRTFTHHRLLLLEQKFNLHVMLNAGGLEVGLGGAWTGGVTGLVAQWVMQLAWGGFNYAGREPLPSDDD